MIEETVEDVIALAVPEDIDPLLEPGFVVSLQPQVEKSVWAQFSSFDKPQAIRFETIDWLLTQDVTDVEAFQPAHDCVTCRAANDQMLAFLREHPTRWVAMGNIRYTEVWS